MCAKWIKCAVLLTVCCVRFVGTLSAAVLIGIGFSFRISRDEWLWIMKLNTLYNGIQIRR